MVRRCAGKLLRNLLGGRTIDQFIKENLNSLPPPPRREVLFNHAELAYLSDPLGRCPAYFWLKYMDKTMSPQGFRRRVEARGWVRLRQELDARVAAAMLHHLGREGGVDMGELDHHIFILRKAPARDLPMPEICSKTRAIWRRVVGEMGPRLWVVPRCNARTRRAMERWEVAEFIEGHSVIVGQLTPLGVRLRDRWHRAACWRDWERYKAAGPTGECGGKNRCLKLPAT